MSNVARNEQIFKALVGRTIQDFGVDHKERKLHVFTTDGIVFSLWCDDEGYLCFDLDLAAPRH